MSDQHPASTSDAHKIGSGGLDLAAIRVRADVTARLSDVEREMLTCDCGVMEDDPTWSETYCPFHADRMNLEVSGSAADLVSTVESILAAHLAEATGNSGSYVRGVIAPAVERILAAREQALREEIAKGIEAKYLGPDSGRGYDGREAPDAALRNAYDEGLEFAARIARGGAR